MTLLRLNSDRASVLGRIHCVHVSRQDVEFTHLVCSGWIKHAHEHASISQLGRQDKHRECSAIIRSWICSCNLLLVNINLNALV